MVNAYAIEKRKTEKLTKSERNHLVEWLFIITNQPRDFWKSFSDHSLINAFEKNVEEHGKKAIQWGDKLLKLKETEEIDLLENAVYKVKDGVLEKLDKPGDGFGKQIITWQNGKPTYYEVNYTKR